MGSGFSHGQAKFDTKNDVDNYMMEAIIGGAAYFWPISVALLTLFTSNYYVITVEVSGALIALIFVMKAFPLWKLVYCIKVWIMSAKKLKMIDKIEDAHG